MTKKLAAPVAAPDAVKETSDKAPKPKRTVARKPKAVAPDAPVLEAKEEKTGSDGRLSQRGRHFSAKMRQVRPALWPAILSLRHSSPH